ncbi:hypothetical protein E0I26_08055 [Flavobacterium rhamnosiphilum]|uniref:Uncharacterized protein n=1 Tax=Flavobacterium rhamnosiphilum TaxID=2541724 RepID=A0A4V6PGD5_9FLAO|nr:hypothetical protein [Flavobacterium rhamnosiphilum]TDE44318.1 hypothetical protein E0I26_08055 [Flavobacterium rhamnosiphilum]
MIEHLVNLLYIQFYQDLQLSELLINDEIDVNETVIDNLSVVLDIIGYPKDNADERGKLSEQDIYNRDFFYQGFTELEYPNIHSELLVKEKIRDFVDWVCGETLELYKQNKLTTDDFLKNIMDIK